MSTENESGVRSFTAGEDLAQYRRVRLNSSGAAVYADANEPHIGITTAPALSGALVSVKLRNHPGTRKMVAAAAITALSKVYGAADGKVNDVEAALGPCVGIALETGDGDGSVIEVLPNVAMGGLAYSNIADSAQVENTDTVTAFDKSHTIPAIDLAVGDVIEVIARAFVEDNNGTDTLTLKLLANTEEIVTSGAVDVADNDIGFIHAFITVRALGASGALSATGLVALGVPGTAAALPFRKAQATEDISSGIAITVTAGWSAAHADNEVELEDLIVIHHKKAA